jgi:deoxyribonuclease V
MAAWPATVEALVALQAELGAETPAPWRPGDAPLTVAGCFVCFRDGEPRAGAEPAWAAAALVAPGGRLETVAVDAQTGGPYLPGLLALRAGPALEQAVRALPERPDVLIADATGRDHPRRAGLAVHLGKVLDLPTVGVTHRTLRASGELPPAERGAHTPLTLDGEVVGAWLRIQPRARPVAVHAAWRTDAETAVAVVMGVAGRVRTPEPLRQARRVARLARAQARATTS